MTTKVLTSMKDENPELQKQIGCISGFFQLFDRHGFLTGQHNTPTQGGTSNNIKELHNTTQKAKAKNVKVARENQQSSTESSSGTSMSSSSCSSSMSSLEFNRTIQIEPPSIISQIKIPENSNSRAEMKQLGTLDFYEIVRDSMHIDAQQGLSVKTVAKEEKKGKILKRIDSPRPLQVAQSVNSRAMVAWDSPRLSYDGRDMQDTFKSATKNKELPRLSLDSRQGSIKSFNEGTKSRSNPLKGPQKGYGGSSTMLKQLQEPETSKRPSGVVAKLMGLEAFPDCTQTCDTPLGSSSCNTNKNETFVGSTLPQSRRDTSITNVTSYSRFSLEQSPWRQPDARQGSQLQASKKTESSTKAPNRSLSVYGEIEKRMADLEFKKSGKDLRALKQILEAMQRYKESLDISRNQTLNSPSDSRNGSSLSESSNVQSPRIRQKDRASATVEMSNSTQGSKSPIVIMKPAKVERKTKNSASNGRLVDKFDRKTAKGSPAAIKHVKDPISQPFHSVDKSNKMRTSKVMQSSKVPQVTNGENSTNSSNVAETRSPRLQKRFGLERRSPPTSPSSDSGCNRRQHNRQSMELSSPSTTPRQRFSTLEERNERLRRDSKQEVDAVLPDFDSKRSMESHSDVEVIHTDHSEKINRNPIHLKGLNENNVEKELSKESFLAETTVTAEQPSPVSVLDAAFYREDPPSPVKRKSDISKDLDEVLRIYDISEENSEDIHLSSNTIKVNFSNGTSDMDLKTHNLVQILQQIDYSDERFVNFGDNKDPDHKYISEILIASELLSGPSSGQASLHSSGYPINPVLFLTLEQIKSNKMHFNIDHSVKKNAKMNNHEQMQRKLIFDVVNEILVQKLILESSSTLWSKPYQPEHRKLEGQQLLDVLCTKIDKLQHKNRNISLANEDEDLTSLLWEDLMHQPTICTECHSEIPNVVLDIERLIFKDLITEVVRGEVANNSDKYCRNLLFPSRTSS